MIFLLTNKILITKAFRNAPFKKRLIKNSKVTFLQKFSGV